MLRESALTRDHLTDAIIFVQSGVRWLLVEFNFGSKREYRAVTSSRRHLAIDDRS
jgi:hypothetical protein